MPLGYPPRGFIFCTFKQAVTAPQQCGAATAFLPSPCRLNGVGYSTTDNSAEESSFIFGASFSSIATKGVVPFKDLNCPEGFEDGDQIQTAYTDERGLSQMNMYWYFGEWLDNEYNSVADTDGIPQGGSAWFISAGPKTITTAGEVTAEPFVHTFTETSALIGSAFPTPFCPNSANISWGVTDGAQIQTAYTDERGLSQMNMFWYFGEWMDNEYNTLAADDSIVPAGTGFWIILSDASETFSEVSPIAK